MGGVRARLAEGAAPDISCANPLRTHSKVQRVKTDRTRAVFMHPFYQKPQEIETITLNRFVPLHLQCPVGVLPCPVAFDGGSS